jgi:chromosome segregation ATPase
MVAIKQTIQKVIASDLACVAKSQYLNDFLGRIETFIAIKKSQVTQLNQIFNTTQTQIVSLRVQIATYSQSITSLNISSLQVQLSAVLDSLQQAYNAYNSKNIDLTPFNLNITANLQSIKNLTAQREIITKQSTIDEQALGDTNTLIASLEQQLAAAKNSKAALEARILVQTSNLTTITKQIDQLNSINVGLNTQINSVNA